MRTIIAIALLTIWSMGAYAVPVRWEFESASAHMCRTIDSYCPSPYEVGEAGYDIADWFKTINISGSLIFDADLGTHGVFSEVNVSLSSQSYDVGYQTAFFDWDLPVTSPADHFVLSDGGDGVYESFLYINLSGLTEPSTLTNTGGTTSFSVRGEYTCIESEFFSDCPSIWASYGASGSLVGTVVPIPATAWLLGSALAGLGWTRRKQAS